MAASPLDSALLSPLFTDADISQLFTDAAMLNAMVTVEVALVKANESCGLIPASKAEQIADLLRVGGLDQSAIGKGTSESGVPVVALVEGLRAQLSEDLRSYLHVGPSSQDIMDLALIVQIKAAVELMVVRLDRLIVALERLAAAHRDTLMVGRTRGQQATPTTFGLKVTSWLLPLKRHATRLIELKSRLLVVQLGGAGGTLGGIAPQSDGSHPSGRHPGLAITESVAERLDLGVPPAPWHAQRDGLAEFASWLSLVSGSLGKIGLDVMLMSQNEVGELSEGGGPGTGRGGSSSMPQKANPVRSEALVTLARFNAGLVSTMHHALLQEHERGGPGWMSEWMALPQMICTTGGSLARAGELLDGLVVNTDRMRGNLDMTNGLVLAEAAMVALAAHIPKPEA
ncbi:MAG: 3-carboxy-cis,cis-muconate cycloisomerase, partial [Pseudomonadota bacterium]